MQFVDLLGFVLFHYHKGQAVLFCRLELQIAVLVDCEQFLMHTDWIVLMVVFHHLALQCVDLPGFVLFRYHKDLKIALCHPALQCVVLVVNEQFLLHMDLTVLMIVSFRLVLQCVVLLDFVLFLLHMDLIVQKVFCFPQEEECHLNQFLEMLKQQMQINQDFLEPFLMDRLTWKPWLVVINLLAFYRHLIQNQDFFAKMFLHILQSQDQVSS